MTIIEILKDKRHKNHFFKRKGSDLELFYTEKGFITDSDESHLITIVLEREELIADDWEFIEEKKEITRDQAMNALTSFLGNLEITTSDEEWEKWTTEYLNQLGFRE